MQIDIAFILAAGMGTRMGEIGKKIPKPLWPVYQKTLLELQVDFCREMGINKIFINAHFMAKEIEAFLKGSEKFNGVELLIENPLLDSGGAVHNLASCANVNYKGNVLLLNADQFLFFEKNIYKEALKKLVGSRACLFGISVPREAKYNEIKLESDKLVEISKPIGNHDFVTYSGLGILKLDGLTPVVGISKFFETVCNYKNEVVSVLVPEDFEYWDFGTAEIYLKSIAKIDDQLKSNKKSQFIDFLNRNFVFGERNNDFYNSSLNSVSLDSSGKFQSNSISWKEMVQFVE
ncbi:MAG: NTP transferase domain-containing protein [Bacteriovoracaceae bacterium]|nr:NTP transferase domain-containing protein [Bacteriovoracaceae bacterium]